MREVPLMAMEPFPRCSAPSVGGSCEPENIPVLGGFSAGECGGGIHVPCTMCPSSRAFTRAARSRLDGTADVQFTKVASVQCFLHTVCSEGGGGVLRNSEAYAVDGDGVAKGNAVKDGGASIVSRTESPSGSTAEMVPTCSMIPVNTPHY